MAIPRELPLNPRSGIAAERILAFGSCGFLFLSAFASSAGLRASFLTLCGLVIAVRWRDSLAIVAARLPRDVAIAGGAWIAICAASLAWSVDPAYTAGEIKPELGYGVLAFLVFFVAAAADRARWPKWWAFALAGTALAFAGRLLQDFGPFALEQHEVDAGAGPYSTHLVLLLPLVFALDWPPPWGRGARMRALALALCLFLAAAWYTGNRIVWIAFGAQLMVAIATWGKVSATPRERAVMLRRLAVIAAVAFAVAFAASVAERYQRNLLHDTGVPAGLEHDLRPKLWETAWGAFREAPWLGHGFGREVLASTFSPLTPKGVNHPEIRHAHDTLIDVALQVGMLGLAAFIALLLALARHYAAMLRDAELAPLGIMGLALVVGFVVKNVTDDFLHRQNALVFWALNAMLLGLARSRPAAAPP